MSWGNKLVVVFIGFAALIGTLVYKAVNTKFELVSKEYYKDELRYQEQIDAAKNASEINPVLFEQTDTAVTLHFPENLQKENIDAQIWFYCKADANRDKKFELHTSDGIINISKKQLFKGSFEIKVRWTTNGKHYYSSKNMTIL